MERELDGQLKALTPYLLVSDIGFLLYWSLSLPLLFGWELIPGEWLFKDYSNPLTVAWNWSFFPLDILLSVSGLMGLRLGRKSHELGRPLLIVSLILTFCAGFMALCYWLIRWQFDLMWWLPNGFLMVWPLFFLPGLLRGQAGSRS